MNHFSEMPAPKPHLTQIDGRTYDVRKLESSAALLPTNHFDLTKWNTLQSVIDGKYWNDTNGAALGPKDLIEAYGTSESNWSEVLKKHPSWSEHVAKIQRVSYQTPVLVYKGNIIDGIHRLTKALLENAASIPYKNLDRLPADAEYNA
ncbi:MAG: hypothetical protein NT003_00700 [Candidatus Magasanikbacteria bacterium]|nr:hypothetical protein [Candidatus Magasanikbacteria bacterium]